MSVIRVKHENNYVVLQKEILENPKISLKAKGLWAFCMAKPDNWEFHITQLADTLLEGKDALKTGIEELINFGYMTKNQFKKQKGQWDKVEYEIFETSQLKKIVPQTGFPVADDPLAENPPLTSIKTSSVEEVNKEQHQQQEADDESKKNNSDQSEFLYTLPNGQAKSISISVIFRNMVGLPYSTDQILEALSKARENASTSAISDPIEYIKAILKNPRKTRSSEKSSNPILSRHQTQSNPTGEISWTIKKPKPFVEPSITE